MSTITKKAFTPTTLTTGIVTYYTCPVNTRTIFKKLTVSNNDTVTRTVSAYLVPSAASPTVANIITIAMTLGTNEARDIYDIEGHCISAGDMLQMIGEVASKLTVHGTVVEITV